MGRAAKRVFIRHILETHLDLDGLAEEVKAVQPTFEVTNINKWQGVKIAFASYHPEGTRLIPAKITDTLQGLPSYFTSFAAKPRTSGRGCKAMIIRKILLNHMSSYRKNAKITP